FANIQNFTGGSGNDRYIFANGQSISGRIDGGLGINTLDYSSYTTSVTVNLTTGAASKTGGVSRISIVLGGSGNDKLTGGTGRILRFGGAGADTLNGGPDEDILFNGTATFQGDLTTLDNLFAYWNRGDLDYPSRVADLRAGVSGVPALNASTVK